MARVVLQRDVAEQFADGVTELEVAADNPRRLVAELDRRFPGIGKRLTTKTAIAIDGEIFQEPFLQEIGEDSEVYFLPMIEGG